MDMGYGMFRGLLMGDGISIYRRVSIVKSWVLG